MQNISSHRRILSIPPLSIMVLACLLGIFEAAFSSDSNFTVGEVPDPGLPGPFTVSRIEYQLDEIELVCRDRFTQQDRILPVEVVGSVHAPENLSAGPLPVALFLHGRHATCMDLNTRFEFYEWPCMGDRVPIWSYQGYDYISEVLASWGFIVISISANGINAVDNNCTDFGLDRRGELIHYHLDQWRLFNEIGGEPFGDRFVGKLDLNRVGLMGHSRGGGGIASAYRLNLERKDPYGINSILPLAPVNFQSPRITNTALFVLLPYCDGDVSDLQGARYYDDARYAMPGDTAPKHYVLEMGGNHNFYNTIWTAGRIPDDWRYDSRRFIDPYCTNERSVGGGRYTAEEVRQIGIAYVAGFFRLYTGSESALAPIFTGAAPQPPSVGDVQVHATYHPPDSPASRLDVDQVTTTDSLIQNALGGAVTQSGLDPFETCVPQRLLAPHTGCGPFHANRPARQLRFAWDSTPAQYASEIPAEFRDVSRYGALSFRVGLNYCEIRNREQDPQCSSRNPVGEPQDFSVVLTDGDGGSASIRVSDFSTALYYPPSMEFFFPNFAIEAGQKVVLNTIRIPLSAFQGVNLSNIESIRFDFGQRKQGALLLNDIMFVQ